MSRPIKHSPRLNALPRRRSAGALSLQSPLHRQRVIPDKRRASNERAANEETRAVALGLEPLSARRYTRKECEAFLHHDIEASPK